MKTSEWILAMIFVLTSVLAGVAIVLILINLLRVHLGFMPIELPTP